MSRNGRFDRQPNTDGIQRYVRDLESRYNQLRADAENRLNELAIECGALKRLLCVCIHKLDRKVRLTIEDEQALAPYQFAIKREIDGVTLALLTAEEIKEMKGQVNGEDQTQGEETKVQIETTEHRPGQ